MICNKVIVIVVSALFNSVDFFLEMSVTPFFWYLANSQVSHFLHEFKYVSFIRMQLWKYQAMHHKYKVDMCIFMLLVLHVDQ